MLIVVDKPSPFLSSLSNDRQYCFVWHPEDTIPNNIVLELDDIPSNLRIWPKSQESI